MSVFMQNVSLLSGLNILATDQGFKSSQSQEDVSSIMDAEDLDAAIEAFWKCHRFLRAKRLLLQDEDLVVRAEHIREAFDRLTDPLAQLKFRDRVGGIEERIHTLNVDRETLRKQSIGDLGKALQDKGVFSHENFLTSLGFTKDNLKNEGVYKRENVVLDTLGHVDRSKEVDPVIAFEARLKILLNNKTSRGVQLCILRLEMDGLLKALEGIKHLMPGDDFLDFEKKIADKCEKLDEYGDNNVFGALTKIGMDFLYRVDGDDNLNNFDLVTQVSNFRSNLEAFQAYISQSAGDGKQDLERHYVNFDLDVQLMELFINLRIERAQSQNKFYRGRLIDNLVAHKITLQDDLRSSLRMSSVEVSEQARMGLNHIHQCVHDKGQDITELREKLGIFTKHIPSSLPGAQILKKSAEKIEELLDERKVQGDAFFVQVGSAREKEDVFSISSEVLEDVLQRKIA